MSKINVPGIDKNILEIRLLLFTFRNNNKFMKTSNTIITPIKLFYRHLLSESKEKKVALVACMRKFITIQNAMIRDNKAFLSQSTFA